MLIQEQAAAPSSRDASLLHPDCCLCAASPPQHVATAQPLAPSTCRRRDPTFRGTRGRQRAVVLLRLPPL